MFDTQNIHSKLRNFTIPLKAISFVFHLVQQNILTQNHYLQFLSKSGKATNRKPHSIITVENLKHSTESTNQNIK